jgi:hypothetical protein
MDYNYNPDYYKHYFRSDPAPYQPPEKSPQRPTCLPGTSTSISDRFGTMYIVTFLGVTQVTEGYRWDYLISNVGARDALRNWVLEMDGCFRGLRCLVGEVVGLNDPLPEPPTMEGNCEFPAQNEEYCPRTDPCQSVVGLMFDDLETSGENALTAGTKQRFSFIIADNLPAEQACFQLKFGYQTRGGIICAPACPCDNPCRCEEENSFTCEFMFPECFTFTGTAGDIRVGYCIGNVGCCEKDGTCEVLTEVDVCDSTIQCCVEVQKWLQTIDFTAIFNVPLTPAPEANGCLENGIFGCCVSEETAVNTCFTCVDDPDTGPLCVDPTCDNTAIDITNVTPIQDRRGTIIGIKIEYTFVTPDCENEVPGQE